MKSWVVFTCGWAVLAISFSVSGCASIIKGTKQNLEIQVKPPGTSVTIYRWDGSIVAGPIKSPGKLEVKRPEYGQPYIIVSSMEGYCPTYWSTPWKRNVWFWMNIFFGWSIGMSADSANGSAFVIEPDPLMSTLAGEQSCAE